MLRPETHKHIARQAEELASIASGEGEHGLANALWAFEAKHQRLVEQSYGAEATRLRDGDTSRLDAVLLLALRKRHMVTREEFERFRALLD